MVNADDIETGTSSHSLLREAEEHYAGALQELHALRLYFRERTDIPEAEVRRVLALYARATQTLFDERKKVEELNKRKGGVVNDYVIDFATLRGDIGRRLDRLRAAAGAV